MAFFANGINRRRRTISSGLLKFVVRCVLNNDVRWLENNAIVLSSYNYILSLVDSGAFLMSLILTYKIKMITVYSR